MKKLIYILFLLDFGSIYAQYDTGGEVFIYNTTSQNVVVRVYPVSGVFNCDRSYPNFYGNYNLVMSGRNELHNPLKDFISGTSLSGNQLNRYWTLLPIGTPNNRDKIPPVVGLVTNNKNISRPTKN